MIELVLHAKKRKRVLIPERWEELTGRQLADISFVICNEIRPVVRAIHLVKILTGLSKKQLFSYPDEIIQANLLPLTEWVLKEDAFSKQLLPKLKLGRRVFYGPSDDLGNFRFVEFHFAEMALHSWNEDKTNSFLLYRFIAILYRPARKEYNMKVNPDGDVRDGFNANLLDANALLLQKKLPYHYALGIMLWYKGCRQKITDMHPEIFNGGNNSDENNEPSYFTLMRMIAKEGTYGNFGDVEQLHLYTALYEMECALEESKRMEAHIAQLKAENNES